jgi:glutamyl-tRNA synthetase
MEGRPTTRLAPSPTGALHLGNARTFLVNWLLARQNNWRVTLRIEDLDGPRIKAGADRQAVEDLRWLGLDWDEGPIYQAPRLGLYAAAIESLVAAGHAYPCVCSRREVEAAASAPHAEDGAAVYPATCRGRFASIGEARRASGREPALRFAVPAGAAGVIEFVDQVKGPQRFDVPRQLGDFVIAKAAEHSSPNADSLWTPAYQLAVVVDDAAMGVTEVVRGDDLLDSTPRQVLLYRALGLTHRLPRYTHLPLVTGPDGRRLAKRHGDTRLSYYRDLGVAPGRVLALMARWCGVATRDDFTVAQLLDAFNPGSLPRQPVVFNVDDDRWLRS